MGHEYMLVPQQGEEVTGVGVIVYVGAFAPQLRLWSVTVALPNGNTRGAHVAPAGTAHADSRHRNVWRLVEVE